MQSFISNSYRAAATALGLGLLMAGTPTFAAAQNTPARTTDPYLVLEHRSLIRLARTMPPSFAPNRVKSLAKPPCSATT